MLLVVHNGSSDKLYSFPYPSRRAHFGKITPKLILRDIPRSKHSTELLAKLVELKICIRTTQKWVFKLLGIKPLDFFNSKTDRNFPNRPLMDRQFIPKKEPDYQRILYPGKTKKGVSSDACNCMNSSYLTICRTLHMLPPGSPWFWYPCDGRERCREIWHLPPAEIRLKVCRMFNDN